MPESFTQRRLFSRRRALQALAAIPLTLPLARMLRAAGTGVSPKRLVLLMQNNGTQQANFWPDANMSSPIIDSLFQDPKTGQDNGLKAKTNLIKGVYIPFDLNDNYGNAHDIGFARMFTGEPLLPSGDQPWGGGISVDQLLANEWGLDSLTLAVLASEVQPFSHPGFDHRVSFSYLGPGTVKQPRVDPLDVYQHLFPTPGTQDAAQRLRLRQSVLDGVTANLSEVSVRLGPAERTKLDYHLTAIRDVERQLGKSASVCISQPRPPQDYRAIDPNAEVSVDDYIPALVNDMIDLAVASLKCGLTRIATIQFGYGGGKWKFAWKGINVNCHEEVAHLDTSDTGSTPENTQRVVLMNQYYASCVSRLAVQLDAVTEDGGTLLDNSLVVWANEQGRGDHSQENVPIVLIGKAGGSIPLGGRVIDGGPQVFNRVGCTILNVMGHPAAGFGDVPDCGVFEGLS